MDSDDDDSQVDQAKRAQAGDVTLSHLPRWSLARLIAIVDEAIDAAGKHLAQSGGLTVWSDDFASTKQAGGRRPVRQPRDYSIYEQPEPVRGPGVL